MRGLENRRRYVDSRPYFLNSTYSPDEIEIFSAEEGRVLRSALSYFMGLYPPNSSINNLTDQETSAAQPPFMVSSESPMTPNPIQNGYQIIPISTNAFKKPDMFMGAFEGKTCPLFSEVTEYLVKHNPLVNKTMTGHEHNIQKWI